MRPLPSHTGCSTRRSVGNLLAGPLICPAGIYWTSAIPCVDSISATFRRTSPTKSMSSWAIRGPGSPVSRSILAENTDDSAIALYVSSIVRYFCPWRGHRLNCLGPRNAYGRDRHRHDSGRHRRLDLRALAGHLLSGQTAAERRTRIRQPPTHLDRGQRHLLRFTEA